MKSYFTLLIATILFGLCLLEKDLKQRAMNEQIADKEVKYSKPSNQASEEQEDTPNDLWVHSLHVSDISIADSTAVNDNGRIQASL